MDNHSTNPLAGSDADRNRLYMSTIDNIEEHIRERIRFREQRFYWLYGACLAISAFLVNSFDANSPVKLDIACAGLFLIQFLVIGIGWNYFANDLKANRLEWRKNYVFGLLKVEPIPYNENCMTAYRIIYACCEFAALCIPSIGACTAICRINAYRFERMVADTFCACPCCHAGRPAEIVDSALPGSSIASLIICTLTVLGFFSLCFFKHIILKFEDDGKAEKPDNKQEK